MGTHQHFVFLAPLGHRTNLETVDDAQIGQPSGDEGVEALAVPLMASVELAPGLRGSKEGGDGVLPFCADMRRRIAGPEVDATRRRAQKAQVIHLFQHAFGLQREFGQNIPVLKPREGAIGETVELFRRVDRLLPAGRVDQPQGFAAQRRLAIAVGMADTKHDFAALLQPVGNGFGDRPPRLVGAKA